MTTLLGPTAKCPVCDSVVGSSEQFCEACGAGLSPTAAAGAPWSEEPTPISQTNKPTRRLTGTDLTGIASTCPACGGEIASDEYCGTCGTHAPRLRDHFTEQPAAWVAAVCDRGLRHTRNEDAVALAADSDPGSRAVLVVCDGVSNSTDSDLASLAAARTARDVLAASHSRGVGTAPSLLAAVVARLEAATDAALEAVLEVTRAATDASAAASPPSCTFVAAVVEQDLLVVGSVGDSRAYWLPDVGAATALTIDDSFAQEQIDSGMPRAQAETGPASHAITRWLGVDAPPHTPRTATMRLVEPGWLLVCSDGLWNYCSAAPDLAAVLSQASTTSPEPAEPLRLARALVAWANAQGGRDNISVALARISQPREEARRDG